MPLLAAIMTSPDFAEVLFLLGLLVGALAMVLYILQRAIPAALVAAAVAIVSFGLLAL